MDLESDSHSDAHRHVDSYLDGDSHLDLNPDQHFHAILHTGTLSDAHSNVYSDFDPVGYTGSIGYTAPVRYAYAYSNSIGCYQS